MAPPRGREILEVFTVDERSAFGGASSPAASKPAPPDHDRSSSRRRWIAGAAVATTVAVVAIVVVSSDDASERSATNTTAPATTAPATTVAPTSSDVEVLPVLSDAPPGYRLAQVERPVGHDSTNGVSELWASAGATANNGSAWFLITAEQTHNGRSWLTGDRRMRLGAGSAVFAAPSPGSNVLPRLSTADDETFLMITGNIDPYLMAEVLGGASTADTDGDGDPDELAFESTSFASELHIVSRVGSDDGGAHPLSDDAASSITFSHPDTWDGFINVTAGRSRSTERQQLIDFLLDERVDLGTAGIQAAYGPLPFGGALMTFDLAGITVTISSPVADEASFTAVAEHARVATTETWANAGSAVQPPTYGETPTPVNVQVSAGTLDGAAWTAVIRGPMADGSLLYSVMHGAVGTADAIVGPADRPSIEVAAWSDETILLAHAPRGDAGSRLRLTIGLDAPVEIPLGDAGAALPWLVTAVPFSDLRLWTAEIIDADGNVLASASSDIESLMAAA